MALNMVGIVKVLLAGILYLIVKLLDVIVPIQKSILIYLINKKATDNIRWPVVFSYNGFYYGINVIFVQIKKTCIALATDQSSESSSFRMPFDTPVIAAKYPSAIPIGSVAFVLAN